VAVVTAATASAEEGTESAVTVAVVSAALVAAAAYGAVAVTTATATEAAVGSVLTSVGEEMAVAATSVMVVAVPEEDRSSIRPPMTSLARAGEGGAQRLTTQIRHHRRQDRS
jgi:hypothetical protein